VKTKIKVLLTALLFSVSVTAQDIKTPGKTSVAVFQFLSETKNHAQEVLNYSLREKLAHVLFSSNKFQVIGQNIINDRIIKRNLDIRTNLDNPKIIQYIGGLVEAQMLVISDYAVNGDEIEITTRVVDATEGTIIRAYKMSGKLNNVDAILNRIASQIELDTQTWKDMGKLEDDSSMAHHLGKLVAQTETVIKPLPGNEKKKREINWKKYLIYLLKPDVYTARYCVEEIYHILNRSTEKSVIATYAGRLFFLVGQKYYNMGDNIKSEENFKTAIWFLPKDENILLKLADFYFKKGNSDESVKIYTQCISLYPESVNAYIGIANVFMSQNSYLMAIYFAGQGLTINSEVRELYLQLANAYALSGKFDKAISAIQIGLKKFPDDQELNKVLSYCYTQLGNEFVPQNDNKPVEEYK